MSAIQAIGQRLPRIDGDGVIVPGTLVDGRSCEVRYYVSLTHHPNLGDWGADELTLHSVRVDGVEVPAMLLADANGCEDDAWDFCWGQGDALVRERA